MAPAPARADEAAHGLAQGRALRVFALEDVGRDEAPVVVEPRPRAPRGAEAARVDVEDVQEEQGRVGEPAALGAVVDDDVVAVLEEPAPEGVGGIRREGVRVEREDRVGELESALYTICRSIGPKFEI